MVENAKCPTSNVNPSEVEPPQLLPMKDNGPSKLVAEKQEKDDSEEKDDREEKNEDTKNEADAKDEDGQVKEGKNAEKKNEDSGVVRRIRNKIQDELSCTICNEVFISVRSTTNALYLLNVFDLFSFVPSLNCCLASMSSACTVCTSGRKSAPQDTMTVPTVAKRLGKRKFTRIDT